MTGKNSPRGRLLSVRELEERGLGAQQTIYNAIHSGQGALAQLPYYRVGRSIRFAEEDVDRFLDARRVAPAGR